MAGRVYQDRALWLDQDQHLLRAAGASILLTRTQWRLLTALLARPGELVSKEELYQSGWPGPLFEADLHLVSWHMSRLRRKISPARIQTIRGFGYRYVTPEE